MEKASGFDKASNRIFFTKLIEAKLLEKKRLTREDIRYMISISYTEAEILRRDSHSRTLKRTAKVAGGIAQIVSALFYNLKNCPYRWFKEINGAVEDGCLVIKD